MRNIIVGFKEKPEIVQEIDRLAEEEAATDHPSYEELSWKKSRREIGFFPKS
jgi:hypothetical protein